MSDDIGSRHVQILESVETDTFDVQGRKKLVDISIVEMDDICQREGLTNKSSIIRWLHSQNYAPAAIARFMGIRYQHVRNVITTPLKRQQK